MLAKAIFRMFDQLHLAEADQLVLLGLEAKEGDVLVSMRQAGELPSSDELADRARTLLRIYRYLSMLYPEHPALREKWIASAHPRLEGESPLHRMKTRGHAGIRSVAMLLEEQAF